MKSPPPAPPLATTPVVKSPLGSGLPLPPPSVVNQFITSLGTTRKFKSIDDFMPYMESLPFPIVGVPLFATNVTYLDEPNIVFKNTFATSLLSANNLLPEFILIRRTDIGKLPMTVPDAKWPAWTLTTADIDVSVRFLQGIYDIRNATYYEVGIPPDQPVDSYVRKLRIKYLQDTLGITFGLPPICFSKRVMIIDLPTYLANPVSAMGITQLDDRRFYRRLTGERPLWHTQYVSTYILAAMMLTQLIHDAPGLYFRTYRLRSLEDFYKERAQPGWEPSFPQAFAFFTSKVDQYAKAYGVKLGDLSDAFLSFLIEYGARRFYGSDTVFLTVKGHTSWREDYVPPPPPQPPKPSRFSAIKDAAKRFINKHTNKQAS